MKSNSINYNSALNIVDILFTFIIKPERLAIIFFIVDSLQRKKSVAILNKVVSSPI